MAEADPIYQNLHLTESKSEYLPQLANDINDTRHNMNNALTVPEGFSHFLKTPDLKRNLLLARGLSAALLAKAELLASKGDVELSDDQVIRVVSSNLIRRIKNPSRINAKTDRSVMEELEKPQSLDNRNQDQYPKLIAMLEKYGLIEAFKNIIWLDRAYLTHSNIAALLTATFQPAVNGIRTTYYQELNGLGDGLAEACISSLTNIPDMIENKEVAVDESMQKFFLGYENTARSMLHKVDRDYEGGLLPSINIILPEGEDLVAHIKPGKMREVLNNLLANSIKYSPAHTKNNESYRPDITVRLEKVGEQVVINWSDHGIGIAKEDLPKVFVGEKIDNEDTKGIHSTGLGLPYCKKMIESMGGNIEVDSAGRGMGTTIKLELPLAETSRVKEPSEQSNRELVAA